MFSFLRRRPPPDPDSIATERWESAFVLPSRARFVEERGADYETRLHERRLELVLKRRQLFAWSVDPLFHYRDFVVDAELSMPSSNGYSAAGLLLRYQNEENYYYFLVSTRGYFRFDVLFNRNRIPLLEWTRIIGPEGFASADRFSIRAVANGDRFTFCIDDQWVGEVDDDHLDAGRLAFGAQNYDERDEARALLHRISVNSVAVDVQAQHVRWHQILSGRADARIELAGTLFAMGSYSAAIIQLRKAFRQRTPTPSERFLMAECQLNLRMYQPALESIDQVLAEEPDHAEAIRERANLLYLIGRYLELREYLANRVEPAASSTLWNLLGHAEFSLGNFERAAEAYSRATALEPEMPLFAVNAARAAERIGRTPEAIDRYLAAARLFLRQEAYDDLDDVLVKVRTLDPSNPEGRELLGKLAFHYGDLDEAERYLGAIVDEGYRESGTLYLLGIIHAQRGDRARADELFTQAALLEPSFALYWFRTAENRYLIGRDPGEALARALELAPEDPWIVNLAGQVALDSGDASGAETRFERAHALAPSELEIALNLAEARYRSGRVKEAFGQLATLADDPRVRNLEGNFYTRLGRPGNAVRCYERALALAPDDPIILENLAAACLECDLVARAEELLARVMELSPSVSVLNRIANLARVKGENLRAETAYQEALKLEPENVELQLNLADFYLDRFRYDDARRLLDGLAALRAPLDERRRRLRERLRARTELRISCAQCGREWFVPRELPPQPAVRLYGEPPDDCPAGRCPRCGNVYCVGCAKEHLLDDRFVCRDCGEPLKLSDAPLRYVVLKALESSTEPARSQPAPETAAPEDADHVAALPSVERPEYPVDAERPSSPPPSPGTEPESVREAADEREPGTAAQPNIPGEPAAPVTPSAEPDAAGDEPPPDEQ